jgi:uncharacterized protein YdeI (YjbR/CyaY-like superfamily)
MNQKTDAFFSKTQNWQKEMKLLRSIMLGTGLREELKWRKPCYAYQNSNLVIIQGFKEYCALLFFNGILLSDPDGVLIKTGENTHVGRQIRFTTVKEIQDLESTIKAYVYESIEAEKAGLKVPVQKKKLIPVPEEFTNKMEEMPTLKTAFNALTPGRQKVYLMHFAQAKQSKTREARIEKCIEPILNGKGLMDR